MTASAAGCAGIVAYGLGGGGPAVEYSNGPGQVTGGMAAAVAVAATGTSVMVAGWWWRSDGGIGRIRRAGGRGAVMPRWRRLCVRSYRR